MSQTMSKRDRWIPWYFVLFFVVVALVDGVMVSLALRTHRGVVTEHPYEKGLAYNRVVAAEEAQEKLGWKATIEYRAGTLNVAIHDAQGAALSPDTVKVQFRRPGRPENDFEVTLERGMSRLDFPLKGVWEARVFAQLGADNYQQSKRLVIE